MQLTFINKTLSKIYNKKEFNKLKLFKIGLKALITDIKILNLNIDINIVYLYFNNIFLLIENLFSNYFL